MKPIYIVTQNLGPKGLIRFFKAYSTAGKTLHGKYPKRYDEKGGNKRDHHHPHVGERIVYLQLFQIGDEFLDSKNIAKRIKDTFANR